MQHIKDEKTKKELIAMEKIRLRVSKIKLENKEKEHLINNFYLDEVEYKEMKDLHTQRWEIKKTFNVLKNKLKIENITGESKIANRTRLQCTNNQYIIQDVKKNEAKKSKRLKKDINTNKK